MLLISGITLISLDREAARQTFDFLATGDGFMILLAGFILLVSLASREKLSPELQSLACFFYYGAFALIALEALKQDSLQLPAGSTVETINVWLIRVILGVAIARGAIAAIDLRSQHFVSFIAQNFSNVQYHLRAFALGTGLAVVATIITHQFYAEPAAAILLGFTYANITNTLLRPYTVTQAHRA